jgi:hypothetical protein
MTHLLVQIVIPEEVAIVEDPRCCHLIANEPPHVLQLHLVGIVTAPEN